MKKEFEITVKVVSDYATLKEKLESNYFKIKEEYEIHDDYMINKNINLNNLTKLEILKKCILVRDMPNYKKVLLYKYKKYAPNGDILEQGKVECPISDITKAINFMEAIDYRKLFHIHDKCIVFSNKQTELVVQLVNNKHIFIELEDDSKDCDFQNNIIEKLKDELNQYNLPIDKSNYFVKKAEITLAEVLNNDFK